MPKMDGLTFLQSLRRQPMPLAATPAIVISTEAAPQDVEAARRAGANFYLVKPVAQDTLDPVCRSVLRDRRVNEFLEQFLIEGRELVEQATEDLLALEEAPEDRARLDSAFRGFHTLKGVAGIVEFAAMSRVLHAAEGSLAAIRSGDQPLSAELVTDYLFCLDQVAQWLDELEREDRLPTVPDATADALVARFRARPPPKCRRRCRPNRRTGSRRC